MRARQTKKCQRGYFFPVKAQISCDPRYTQHTLEPSISEFAIRPRHGIQANRASSACERVWRYRQPRFLRLTWLVDDETAPPGVSGNDQAASRHDPYPENDEEGHGLGGREE